MSTPELDLIYLLNRDRTTKKNKKKRNIKRERKLTKTRRKQNITNRKK